MEYKIRFDNWLSNPALSVDEVNELNGIADDSKEIEYRFGAELNFGTAGMRGIIGIGTNMMNVYTVRRATAGLAEYIKTLGAKAEKRGVAISFDTRKNSELFARCAAGVLLENGIRVYAFTKPHPVPMLSYAVRKLGCVSGIMITASHNPKEYNGYKVYGEDGAQMSPEATEKVVEFIKEIKDYFSVKYVVIPPYKVKKDFNGLRIISRLFDISYYKQVLKQSLSKSIVKKQGKNLKIVYTPLHGSGYQPVIDVLRKIGIKPIVVDEQTTFDENFSTVEVPNPERADALKLGIELANKVKADIVFGTDPDCDRLGVAIRNEKGEFISLSGNQVGALLTDYILLRLKDKNEMPKNGVVIKSFVSTGMVKLIAEDYGAEIVDVPVGFKFIGEKIKQYEADGSKTFIFGFEESCGYLRGTYARDKDAVVAGMLFAEMAGYYASKKQSVYGKLNELYERYGYILDYTESIMFEGVQAMELMTEAVDKLRKKQLESIDIYNVIERRDYLTGKKYSQGEESDLDAPTNNSIFFGLENGIFVCMRPSGTEPKLKIYYSMRAKDEAHAKKALEHLKEAFKTNLS